MKSSKHLFNPEYWDCNCDEYFIHKKPRNYCPKCGMVEYGCPDSWAHEVEEIYDPFEDSALVLSSKILHKIQLKGIQKSS